MVCRARDARDAVVIRRVCYIARYQSEKLYFNVYQTDFVPLKLVCAYGKCRTGPHHRASCIDSIFIYTSQIFYQFHFVSHSISALFLFRFLFHLITEFELELYGIQARLQANIFIKLQSS